MIWVVVGLGLLYLASIGYRALGIRRANEVAMARDIASIAAWQQAHAAAELAKYPGATFVYGATGLPNGIKLPPDYWEKQRPVGPPAPPAHA